MAAFGLQWKRLSLIACLTRLHYSCTKPKRTVNYSLQSIAPYL